MSSRFMSLFTLVHLSTFHHPVNASEIGHMGINSTDVRVLRTYMCVVCCCWHRAPSCGGRQQRACVGNYGFRISEDAVCLIVQYCSSCYLCCWYDGWNYLCRGCCCVWVSTRACPSRAVELALRSHSRKCGGGKRALRTRSTTAFGRCSSAGPSPGRRRRRRRRCRRS